jgi:RNA polymerase sigma factor (sigma-70 family)
MVLTTPMARSHRMIAPPLSALSDEDLVARFRSGAEAPFDEIHRRYRGPLLAFARRMLNGTGHEADDVVQDAFIRAYRGLRVTDRPMALRPWLYMIVRNRALDELRSPPRAGAFDDDVAIGAVATADPAERAQERDEMRRLVAEIARLPERQRMALVMREFDGCSHVETARRMRTTVPATKSLLIRARSTLGAAVRAA